MCCARVLLRRGDVHVIVRANARYTSSGSTERAVSSMVCSPKMGCFAVRRSLPAVSLLRTQTAGYTTHEGNVRSANQYAFPFQV